MDPLNFRFSKANAAARSLAIELGIITESNWGTFEDTLKESLLHSGKTAREAVLAALKAAGNHDPAIEDAVVAAFREGGFSRS